MTVLGFIRRKITGYGRLRSYLAAVSFISAAVSLGIAAWFITTFFGLVGAFKDVHNEIVDLLRCFEYLFRALSLTTLFIFFVGDYGKRGSAKFRLALLFLLIQNVFAFAYFVFNSVWNSFEYISRSDLEAGMTLRVLVFILFLLSLYGLYRQSKTGFASAFGKGFLLLLFIGSVGASIWLEQERIYGGGEPIRIIFAELAGFIVYSPYVLYIMTGNKAVPPETKNKKRPANKRPQSVSRPAPASKKRSSRAVREPRMGGK